MKARTVLGALIGLGGVGAVGFGLLHLNAMGTPAASKAATPAATGQPVAATQSGDVLTVGVTSSYPTVSYKDTGAADWSFNPVGWDYGGRGVLNVGF